MTDYQIHKKKYAEIVSIAEEATDFVKSPETRELAFKMLLRYLLEVDERTSFISG